MSASPTSLTDLSPGVAMILSLLSALAIGLVLVSTVLTVALPFVIGLFGRRGNL